MFQLKQIIAGLLLGRTIKQTFKKIHMYPIESLLSKESVSVHFKTIAEVNKYWVETIKNCSSNYNPQVVFNKTIAKYLVYMYEISKQYEKKYNINLNSLELGKLWQR